MRWKGRRKSTRVEDRRGRRTKAVAGAGLGGGALVIVLLFTLFTGEDPAPLLDALGGIQARVEAPPGAPAGAAPTDEIGEFAAVVLADTEKTWSELLPALGHRYELPILVLFTDAVQSACGFNSAAVGPFYCPADSRLYLDLGFFDQLARRLGAPGDFAQAYVIAHEVGHHVQNVLGVSGEVQRRQQGSSRREANALSVRLELQADCLAGVWGHHAHRRGLLEPGDVEEGLAAAAAIGDDRLQSGTVRPETWTHGSSQQRVEWLRQGLENGDPEACDTFAEGGLG